MFTHPKDKELPRRRCPARLKKEEKNICVFRKIPPIFIIVDNPENVKSEYYIGACVVIAIEHNL